MYPVDLHKKMRARQGNKPGGSRFSEQIYKVALALFTITTHTFLQF